MDLIMKDFKNSKQSFFRVMASIVNDCHFHNKLVDRVIDYNELRVKKIKLDEKSSKIDLEMKKLEAFLGIKNS